MTILEQADLADRAKEFIAQWGLRQKFVAKVCGIPEGVFSMFVNKKLVLSNTQIRRVTAYIDDYIRRNS